MAERDRGEGERPVGVDRWSQPSGAPAHYDWQRDAHGLYAQYGFTPLSAPDRWMEKWVRDVYGVGR